MDPEYVGLRGEPIAANELKTPRATWLTAYVLAGSNPYVSFVAAKRTKEPIVVETVILDIKVDRPRKVKHDVRFVERVSISFDSEDSTHPEVFALRSDFPRVPHTNLRSFERPKSLCLYERTFDEIKHLWTPESFISQIEFWLSKTALGELHDDDQTLEPFLGLHFPKIIVPASLYFGKQQPKQFYEILKIELGSKYSLVANEISESRATGDAEAKKYPPVHGLSFHLPPVTHGVINRTPETFGDLCDLLSRIGFNLLNELRDQLKSWLHDGFLTQVLLGTQLVIFLTIPHRRDESADTESVQPWAFIFNGVSIRNVGEEIGIWSKAPDMNVPGYIIGTDENKKGFDLPIEVLVPVSKLTPDWAARLNGRSQSSEIKGFMLGAGALGGYTLQNLVKTGFGKWTIMDSDILLPHNSARHAVPSHWAGYGKAELIANGCNRQFSEPRVAYIHDDLLDPLRPSDIETAIVDAEIIIDCSASVPAARKLERSYDAAPGRRVSVFLSPNGNDLVILAESLDRTIRLDLLEMQYLRAVNRFTMLDGHLHKSDQRVRYARTCADVSSTIPNDLVVLHSAIASKQIKAIAEDPNASITIWRSNPEDFDVEKIEVKVEKPFVLTQNGWTVSSDEGIVSHLRELRAAKLPVETGGSLVGSFDLVTKTIFVVDTLPTPSDSIEERTKFIRGEKGNINELEKVRNKTSEQLFYIGEWHSHPRGASAAPSDDDFQLLHVLESRMHPAGFPAAMLIIGEGHTLTLMCTTPGYTP